MNESQIIGDLVATLDEEVRNVHAQPGAAARARARARRRRTARRLLAGVPAVALAVGLVAAAQHHFAGPTASRASAAGPGTGQAGQSRRPAATTPGRPPAETAAYVVKQVEAALGNADNYIIRQVTTSYQGGTWTQWTDPRTGSSFSAQGTGSAKALSWGSTFFVHRVLHWRTTEADYSTHTWFVSIIHAAGPIQGAENTGPQLPGGSPALLRKWLADGFMHLVGHGYVNGHHAIELRAHLGIITETFWVDARTFQPVRWIKGFGGPPNAKLVFNEYWMSRTPALTDLANTVHIPAGFTQVAPPR